MYAHKYVTNAALCDNVLLFCCYFLFLLLARTHGNTIHTHTNIKFITKLQFRKCQQCLSNLTPQRMRTVPEIRLQMPGAQPQFYGAKSPVFHQRQQQQQNVPRCELL